VFRFAAVVRRKVWLGLFFKCTPTSMLKLSVHRSKKGCVRHYSISFCKFSYLFSCPQTLLLLLIHLYSEPDESEAHIQGTLSSSCICIFFLKKTSKSICTIESSCRPLYLPSIFLFIITKFIPCCYLPVQYNLEITVCNVCKCAMYSEAGLSHSNA
jgi:hypothetical protein